MTVIGTPELMSLATVSHEGQSGHRKTVLTYNETMVILRAIGAPMVHMIKGIGAAAQNSG
jgi:hypothetical protein